jgi:(2Fe-2S) ferredoxin
MGKCNLIQTSDFTLEGRFLGYAANDRGKLKYIRLSNTNNHLVKLSKDLRSHPHPLRPGEWLQVSGTRQVNPITGQVKLKATALTCSSRVPQEVARPCSPVASKPKKTETILVCQKSDCCKLGAKAIAAALTHEIEAQGLANQVTVKGTGCMKRCKAGPNIVMPDKTRYTKISAKAIPAIIEEHFAPAPIAPAAQILSPAFVSVAPPVAS